MPADRRQDRREPARGVAAAAAQPRTGHDQDRCRAGTGAVRPRAARTRCWSLRTLYALRFQPGAGRNSTAARPAWRSRKRNPARRAGAALPARRRRRWARLPIRRCPRPANTKPCSRGNSSMHGSKSCARPTNSRSTPKPIRSTRCAPTWSASVSASSPAAPASRSRTTIPARRHQLPRAAALDALRLLFADPARKSSASTASTTCTCCGNHGVDVAGYADDTMLELRARGRAAAPRHGFAGRAPPRPRNGEIRGSRGQRARRRSRSATSRSTTPRRYAAEDADVTLRLHRALKPRLEAEPGLLSVYRDIEMPLVPVLERSRPTACWSMPRNCAGNRPTCRGACSPRSSARPNWPGAAFNLDSPKQLGQLLFEELKLPALVKTPGGAPSTNEEALEAIADAARTAAGDPRIPRAGETAQHLHRQAAGDGQSRHRPRAHQLPPGRRRDRAPRLQRPEPAEHPDPHRGRAPHPPRLRRARGRVLVAGDYSQIELRIMAHLSQDPALVRAFERRGHPSRDRGGGVRQAAGRGHAERTPRGQAINFGLMYGMGAFGLARQLGIPRGEAQDYIALYFSRYPGVRDFMERTRQQAREQGYVETVFGRRLYLPYIASRNQGQRAGAERAPRSTRRCRAPRPTSSSARWPRSTAGWPGIARARLMILQVHDELVFECETGFVDTLLPEVRARAWKARRNCACRWSWTPGRAPTGTTPTEPGGAAKRGLNPTDS